MGTIRFAPLDVKSADFGQLAALRRRQTQIDTPQWAVYDAEVVRDGMRTSNPAVAVENWQGTVDGRMVAFADMLLPRHEGRENAHIDGIVHPALRRRGIGSALFRLLRERAIAAGRTNLSTVAIAPLERGGEPRGVAPEEFCRRQGMSKALTSVRSRLELSAMTDERLADLSVHAGRAATD
ncbi:MAG: GNAT family N-acetyltransferase, partial [Stackebrandtia sp.]